MHHPQRRLRIAFLDSWLQQVVDGSGTAAAIGGLGRALQQRGHHIARIGPTGTWPTNLTARRIGFNLYLPALLRALHYDLIVGFDIDGFALAGRITTPYVCSVKGVISEELQHEQGNIRRLLWSLSRLERINARNAPLVLTTSDYCRRAIERHYGVPATRVRLVPEGIDLARWDRVLAAGGGRQPDGRTILCVARQYPRKHIVDLVQAFSLLRGSHPQARLVLIGDGPEHGRIRQLITQLNLDAAVRVLGGLPDDDAVVAWYRRASIFCLPSVQEGFGIVFLEAMAAGLPIVATSAAAIPEVVPDGQVGLLVPPSDPPALAAALARLLEQPQLRAELGNAGCARVAAYDWPQVAARFVAAVADQVSG